MMQSRFLLRALVVGAGVALAIVLAIAGYRHWGLGPGPNQALGGIDPAGFVAPAPALDAPNIASDMRVVDAMLGLAQVRPGEHVIDLGSGDGRILIAAARSNGARGLGVDIDPARIAEANANARAAGVAGLVAFRREDLFQTPLADADVLTLYLTQEVNLRLRPRILAQMRPGARVVSHDYHMGDWRWDERRRVGTATIYLWIVPARVAGNWTLTAAGRTVPLVLVQDNRLLSGTAGGARVEQGRVTGADIRFIADAGGGRQVFEGRVDGDNIVPAAPNAGWRAVRAR